MVWLTYSNKYEFDALFQGVSLDLKNVCTDPLFRET